jgi:hypothetical protein
VRPDPRAPRENLRTGAWRLALALLLFWALGLGAVRTAHAQVHAVEVPQLRVERGDDGLYLSATVGFDLPPLVENALAKGIPLFFVAEAEVLRDRWYWSDQRVALAQRHMRLAYQPLTRRWRLNVSPVPIGNTSLGVTLGQNFDELSDALDAIKRLSRWRIAELPQVEAGRLEPGGRTQPAARTRRRAVGAPCNNHSRSARPRRTTSGIPSCARAPYAGWWA